MDIFAPQLVESKNVNSIHISMKHASLEFSELAVPQPTFSILPKSRFVALRDSEG
jgi:hypothetical protein